MDECNLCCTVSFLTIFSKKKKKRKDFTENSSGGQLFKKPAASWLECVFIKYIGPKFYR